jgi:hypothetical protein
MVAGGIETVLSAPVLRINLYKPRSRWAKYRRRQAKTRARVVKALKGNLFALLTIGYAAWVAMGRPERVELPEGRVPACALCGARSRLSVDHRDGRGWSAAALAWKARLENYLAEFRAGVRLRLLCLKCNGKDGHRRRMDREPGEEG